MTTAAVTPSTPELFSSSEKELILLETSSGKLDLTFTLFLVFFHIGALAALFFFSWKALAITAVIWILAQNGGIAMAYHRLLTHRGYQVPRWLEYFLTTCATLALQGGPIYWVAVHRLHHQYTDRPGDPHSPREGAWWSHIGWITNGNLSNQSPLLKRYAPDLMKDSYYRWLSKNHWLPIFILAAGLAVSGYLLGGAKLAIGFVLWGVFLRVVCGWHATWLVNSATHMFGSRRWAVKDDSTNNWWVALLTGGEGWHNNHHAHPVSAKHGMAWYEVDFNWWGILLLKKLGLAKKVYAKELAPAEVGQRFPRS
jgi:stearoyl-CoA desaturase (delta-9 desaturase)